MNEEKVMPAKEDARKALLDFVAIMDEMDLPYCLDGGTLLGFYRDGDFCADDWDDMDFTLPADYWPVAEEINRKMLEKGFRLYHSWDRNKTEHLSGQYAWKRGDKETGEVKVDLMFKERKGDWIWWTIYGGPKGVTYKAVPAHLLWPTRTLDTMHLRIPEGVSDYLTFRYEDWRTPVHRRDYSCYKTDKCIVENYESI